jgi:N-acetylgalactosamine kinase
MDVLVDGNIPVAAGLSSSSAFVCCSGLATMYVNGGHLSKTEIADVCTWCERYIGTEGGGMDQSISFLAEMGQVCG